LQSTTQNRLTPLLLPGILELSRRARYFSFHAYLLDCYRQRRYPAETNALSRFIKAREWDYGLAVLLCPHHCGSVPVGASKLRTVMAHAGPPYPRDESVESLNGGYGLYYRSPMAEFGIVARARTLLGGTPIPIDVLYDNDRARRLADTFRAAVSATAYVRDDWMATSAPLPEDVLVEYGTAACLCQLAEHPEEREAVHEAMFGYLPADLATAPAPSPSLDGGTELAPTDGMPALSGTSAVDQRRRSVAHYLTLLDATPALVADQGAYREALWSPPAPRSAEHARVAGQWAGLVAKDVWQEALASVWSEFTRAGPDASYVVYGRPLTWEETQELARAMLSGPPALEANQLTTDLAAAIRGGVTGLLGRVPGPLPAARVEELRAETARLDSATSGLVVMLELFDRAAHQSGLGWQESASIGSAWQPSVRAALAALGHHLAQGPTVADTLWWLVQEFIFDVHQRIAYSKLPEHTFRFCWEEGRVRFYDNGTGRFPLAAIRWETLASLTKDLGLWGPDATGSPVLTARGQAFVAEVLG
jgi:hypothetical protein